MTAQGLNVPSLNLSSGIKPAESIGFGRAKQAASFRSFMDRAETAGKDPVYDRSKDKAIEETASKFEAVLNQNKVQLPEEAKTEEVPADSSETCTLAKELYEQIKEFQEGLAELLGISKEELNRIMENLGVDLMQLLDPKVLQQLLLNTGEYQPDIGVLLTDEGLAAKMQDIMDLLDQFSKQFEARFLQTPKEALSKQGVSELIQALAASQKTGTPETISTQQQEINTELAGKEPFRHAANQGSEESHIDFKAVKAEDTMQRQQAGSEDSSRQQPGKADSSGLDVFLQNLEGSRANQEVGFDKNMEQARSIRDITLQIVDQIKLFIKPNQTSVQIQLYPEHLGHISLEIISKEGVMTAQFLAQSQAAKEAIESQVPVLRESIESQGIKVEAIEVTVSDFSFHQNYGAGSEKQTKDESKRRQILTLEEAKEMDNFTDTELVTLSVMEQNGNTVDYTA